MKESGLDYIVTNQEKSDLKKFVFWEPGSCLSLFDCSIKNSKKCEICLEYSSADMGFSCTKDHFNCWLCLGDHIEHATGPDAVGKSIDEKTGNLVCPSYECSEHIKLLSLAREKVPENIFELLNKKMTEFETKKAVEKELKKQEARLKKQYEDLMKIKDEEERKAAHMRLEIVNDILTLRCPRCKLAFLDYTGCAALTCSNCHAGFCAMCLKDCGTDAHSHVPSCPDNVSRNVYVRENEFDEHHRKRREKVINEKLKGLSPKTRRLLLEKLGKDLEDLGIKVDADNRYDVPVDKATDKKLSFLNRFF